MAVLKAFEFLIQWHLTERCNLSCAHCYQTGGTGAELSLAEIRGGLSEIDAMFGAWSRSYGIAIEPGFNITGGEPLLRHDLFDILAELRRRRYASFLLTNGTLIDRAQAGRLAGLGLAGAQVSIEGCDKVHDAIRGAGSFGRAIAGAGHLLDAGVPVTLNVTLSRLNAQDMEKVVFLASRLGVQRVGFSRLVPAGRGSGLLREMLSPGEVKRLYASLFSIDIGGLEIVTGDPLAAQLRADCAQRGNGTDGRKGSDGTATGGCSAGVAGLTLLADGTIVPCRRMPIPLGNIRIDSLREIWATSPVLEALRSKERYTGRCGVCGRWESCRGCRAIAYAAARSRGLDDFLAEDPQCFLSPPDGTPASENSNRNVAGGRRL